MNNEAVQTFHSHKKEIEYLNNRETEFENDRIKHNNLHFVTNKEAEMVKMFKNCFLATKVSFCNEIYQFCNIKNIQRQI